MMEILRAEMDEVILELSNQGTLEQLQIQASEHWFEAMEF